MVDPKEEAKRLSLEGKCPICKQVWSNVEEHISTAHTVDNGHLDIGVIKWIMEISKDVDRLNRNQKI